MGEREIIITLCQNLATSEAARIFLNINTEQRPVPKSLIYDLFGEVVDDEDHAINRAADIARELNEEPDSPFYKTIKFPGTPRGVGRLELSTFVSALKLHLKPDGVFQTHHLRSLVHQRDAMNNFFTAIQEYYQKEKIWNSKTKNPFLKAAGFNGAVDYLTGTLIRKCAEEGSFQVKTIKQCLGLEQDSLLVWDDLRGMDGKTSRKKVREYLEYNILNSLPAQHEYEF